MPEPLSHSAAGALAAAPLAAASANFLGLDPHAIGWAFIGGAVYLVWLGRMDHWFKACSSIFISTAVGTCFAQNATEPALLFIRNGWPYMEPWTITGKLQMMSLIAIVVGIFCQALMPGLMKRAKQFGEKKDA